MQQHEILKLFVIDVATRNIMKSLCPCCNHYNKYFLNLFVTDVTTPESWPLQDARAPILYELKKSLACYAAMDNGLSVKSMIKYVVRESTKAYL